MHFQTHISMYQIVKFEFSKPGHGSMQAARIHTPFNETVALLAPWKWLECSRSIAIAFWARKPQFTIDALHATVTIQSFSTFELQKQSKIMMQGVQIEKNHQKWLRIGEEFWKWSFCVLEQSWENEEVFGSSLGNCEFCYD